MMKSVYGQVLQKAFVLLWLVTFAGQVDAQGPTSADWQTVNASEAGFSFEMPGQAERGEGSYAVTTEEGNTVFKVTFAIGASNLEGEAQQRLDAIRDAEVAAVKGELKSEKPITFKGHPGRSLQVTLPGEAGMEIRYRVYIIDKRVLEMIVITSKDSQTGPVATNHFFNSLKLIPMGAPQPPKSNDGGMTADFDKLDGNQDGVLSGQEAASVANLDKNGDGEITRKEFEAGSQPQPLPLGEKVDEKTAKERFSLMDINHDGRLSGTEMNGQEAMDANGDKRITLDEYLAAVLDSDADNGPGETRTVMIPQGQQPFKISMGDCVRLQGQGIAGSNISIDIEGPGRLISTNQLQYVMNGRPAIGGMFQEFEIVPESPGTITAKITVTYPNTPQTRVTSYQFTAE
jgi:hypothetical protein